MDCLPTSTLSSIAYSIPPWSLPAWRPPPVYLQRRRTYWDLCPNRPKNLDADATQSCALHRRGPAHADRRQGWNRPLLADPMPLVSAHQLVVYLFLIDRP